MPKISVIGSLNMDLIVQTERMPLAGETIAGQGFKSVPGGKGANQAIAAAKAGAKTRMFGYVGADGFGDLLLSSLTEAGVDISNIARSSDHPSGIATILLENSGENRIIIIPGSNDLVDQAYIDSQWDEISNADLLVVQHEIPLNSCHYIINKAHQASIPVLLNPAPFYPIPDEILTKLEYLVLNETELQGLVGCSSCFGEELISAAHALLDKGLKNLIITLGKQGSMLLTNKNKTFQPIFEVDAVDTTAAGDTFVGFLATAIMNGQDAKHALEVASAAAALAVTKIGAQSSIPSIEETLDLIEKNKNRKGEL